MAENDRGTGEADEIGEASVVVDYSDAQFVSGCWHGDCAEFGEGL
jgi:hypothetical protein